MPDASMNVGRGASGSIDVLEPRVDRGRGRLRAVGHRRVTRHGFRLRHPADLHDQAGLEPRLKARRHRRQAGRRHVAP